MPGNPLTDPNWAPDLADQITGLIGKVRDKTTNNAVKAVRAIVFGLIGVFLGIVAVVLSLIAATRALQSLFDIWFEWDKAVYFSYLVFGGILTVLGTLLMTKRHSTDV